MLSKGIHFADVFYMIGIKSIYIYGLGEMGQILMNDLEQHGNIEIKGTFDKKSDDSYEKLIASDDPIIVTPIALFGEIKEQLLEAGIDSQRLLSIAQILTLYEYVEKCGISKVDLFRNKNFLIVGANFDNKGSQAMTFVAISELQKRFKGCIIWFLPNFWDDIYKREKYRMIVLEDGMGKGSLLDEILPRLDAVIDVSGYAFSSTKGFGDTERNLEFLRMAYDNNIPYFCMPQSFGPLDYPEYKLAEMRVLLSYPKVVYAREKAGKDILEEKLKLTNVKLSDDLVLQNKTVKYTDCYCDKEKVYNQKKVGVKGVVVVPNSNLLLYVSEEELLNYYRIIIDYLLEKNKKIYIIPHSSEYMLCQNIYSEYTANERVTLYQAVSDCFEFSELVGDASYMIASRYHSIVHAYREGIPCIAIGWADKYGELLRLLGQEEFLVDSRIDLDACRIKELIDKMEKSSKEYAHIISDKMDIIQKENCFDALQYLNHR